MASFTGHLTAADSLLDLARLLGDACLGKEAELQRTRRKARQAVLLAALETRVRGSNPSVWTAAVAENPANLSKHVGQELADLLAQADTYYPLDCLGVLRGLLQGPLRELFDVFEGEFILGRGMPVPFATRPVNKVIKPKPTPYQPMLSSGDLLDGCGALLFEHSSEAYVRVCLDFSRRKAIDELTWEAEERLPRIASIHPPKCGDLKGSPIGDDQFFDAGPRHWNLEEVLDLLKGVAGEVEIAVLPELCLEEPDTLKNALGQAPQDYPDLIVAGSAHIRLNQGSADEVRANETRVYLRGEEVSAYRKTKAYKAKMLNGESLAEPLTEGLTNEPKTITVLSGDRTRLGVVICADLNHQTNPSKLLAAGVNLLIVPSFTPHPGSFNSAIAGLAGYCQGVSLVTNAPPDEAEDPFHLMVAVPRPKSEDQTGTFPKTGDEHGPTAVAIIDPNKPLDHAVEWRS